MILKNHGINSEIDDEMVVVINELNRLGLKTISCCSGHPERDGTGMAQLSFLVKDATVLIKDGIISINWERHATSGGQ